MLKLYILSVWERKTFFLVLEQETKKFAHSDPAFGHQLGISPWPKDVNHRKVGGKKLMVPQFVTQQLFLKSHDFMMKNNDYNIY